MPLSRLLIIFTRYPQAGTTKTRLIPALGPQGAADLQRQLTEATVAHATRLAAATALTVELHFSGGTKKKMASWLGGHITTVPQGKGDIGDRMAAAFAHAFSRSFLQVMLVGSDIPELDQHLLARGFSGLERHDLVLGPAADGGYYLIGMNAAGYRRAGADLFSGIPWSTDRVLSRTMAAAGRSGMEIDILPLLRDIDRPEDLRR